MREGTDGFSLPGRFGAVADRIRKFSKPDLSAYEKEFNETGQFSDDSYAKLQALGISRAMVDQYTAGVVAAQNQQRQEKYWRRWR